MQDLKPTVWIGKQGCTGTMIDEIVSQLKKRKLIKVKWLQNTDVDPEAIAAQAKARLVEVRGRTMVLADKGRGQGTPATPVKTPAKVTAKATARASVRSMAKSSEKASVKDIAKDTKPSKPRRIGMMSRAKK
jgi:RNA-binding protein